MLWIRFFKVLFRPRYVIPILLVISTWYLTQHVVVSDYEKQISDIKKSSAEALALEARRVLSLERQLSGMNDLVEQSYVEQQKIREEAGVRIDTLVRDGNRLFDRNKQLRTSCDSSAAATQEHHDRERRELSEEFTRLLLNEANRADGIVDQLTACQAYVKDLHRVWEESTQPKKSK